MKYFSLILFFAFFSCGNKEDILLPKANLTLVKDVVDLSPIYIFFRINGKDTLAEVNRKNSIITTNWILNIDKRLTLKLVIPEVMKLQQRKREEKEHRNESALNYYSYADTLGKNLAFLPFTDVYYSLEKPKKEISVFFAKNNTVSIGDKVLTIKELPNYLVSLSVDNSARFVFCFSKEMTFESYIQNKILISGLNFKKIELFVFDKEFVF
jgi:hypothetical protein